MNKNKNIAFVSIVIVTGLVTLDIVFKGQVYQRLPIGWQDSLSKRIGRQPSKK